MHVLHIPPITLSEMKLLLLNPMPLLTTSPYDVSSMNWTVLIKSLGLGPVTELPMYLSVVMSISMKSLPVSFCHLIVTLRSFEMYDPVSVTLLA